MSLGRTALRFAVINALAADPFIAAACPDRVFDSAMGEYIPDPVPSIVVFTEDDNGEAWSVNNGGPPFNAICDLTFEISVCATIQDGDMVNIFYAATDRESEALLDVIEYCAVLASTNGESSQSALVRQVARRCSRFRSVRYASEETGAKLARRLVTLTMEIKSDDEIDVPTGPFAALPDPLRTVAAALDPASSAYAICQDLASKLAGAAPPADPEFTGVDVTYALEHLDPNAAPVSPGDPGGGPTFAQEINVDDPVDP